MTNLDHNRSRFGFSATRARLPVPRARLDRHDETSSTGPPSEEQPRVGFQSALTSVIHRHESHTPPNSSIQTKSFAAAQPRSRTLGSHHQRQLDQPDPEEGACSPSWHWRCRWPCSLITGRSGLCSRGVQASSCVRYRALRRRMHPAQRYILTPMIHLRRLLRGSCRLHSLYIRTHLRLLLAARLLSINTHRVSAASSCISSLRNGEQGAAPWATTLPELPVSMRTLPAHTLSGKSQFCKTCTAGPCLHLQRGERKCRRFLCGIVDQGSPLCQVRHVTEFTRSMCECAAGQSTSACRVTGSPPPSQSSFPLLSRQRLRTFQAPDAPQLRNTVERTHLSYRVQSRLRTASETFLQPRNLHCCALVGLRRHL